MLLRKQFGGSHQRGLVAVLQRQQHREQRDHGLAGSHVAHQQPVHAPFGRHVSRDFLQRGALVAGKAPGKRRRQRGGEVCRFPIDYAAGAGAPRQGAGP